MTVKTLTRSDWLEHSICWNNQIDEFERLWARWVSDKRPSEIHWRIEDDLWALHQRMLHARLLSNIEVEATRRAARDLVDEFRVALEGDLFWPKRQRHFAVGPATPNDFHLNKETIE